MTNIMNQVTCSLCNIKTNESRWTNHLGSTNHLQLCKNDKNAKKFFEMIVSMYSKKSEIYDLKIKKH